MWYIGNIIGKIWRRNVLGKVTVGCSGLLLFTCLCGIVSVVFAPKPTQTNNSSGNTQTIQVTIMKPVRQETIVSAPKVKVTEAPVITPDIQPTHTSIAPTNAPLPTAILTPEDVLGELGRRQFGDKFMAVKLGDVEGNQVATIDYDLGTQWDGDGAVFSAISDMKILGAEVFKTSNLNKLELRSYTDFKDKFGNTKKEVAFKFTLTREFAEKVNWTGINTRQLAALFANPEDGNGVYVHPGLKEAWRNYLNGG